jgi:hypothetical protein
LDLIPEVKEMSLIAMMFSPFLGCFSDSSCQCLVPLVGLPDPFFVRPDFFFLRFDPIVIRI